MKKESTSRRKKLPLLLGALLIISVAAYGTRAYFSDSASLQGDIQLSLGTVDITTTKDEFWESGSIAGANTTAEENVDLVEVKENSGQLFTNVRPGDFFTRNYTITNTGTLEAKVIETPYLKLFTDNKIVEDGAFAITIENLEKDLILDSKGGEKDSASFKVTIKVDPDKVDDKFNNKNSDLSLDKIAKDYLEKEITIKAVQTNTK